MNYKTVEVGLENGCVRALGAEALPANAHALLTILAPLPDAANGTTRTLGDALREVGTKGRRMFTDLSTNKQHLDDFGK